MTSKFNIVIIFLLVIGVVFIIGYVRQVAEDRLVKEEPTIAEQPEVKINEEVKSKININEEEVKPKEPKKQIIEWAPSTSPPGGGVWSITISPSNPEVIYAATRDLNILKSSNGGENWEQKSERRLGAHIFSNIALDPDNPDKVYASNGRLHISADGGGTWQGVECSRCKGKGGGIGSSENSLGIVGIAVSPSDPNIVYAHDTNGDVYKSVNKGINWGKVGKVQGFTLSNTLLVDSKNSDIVYIMTNNNKEGVSQILKSEDGAKTFKTIIEKESIRSLVISQKNPAKLYFASAEGLYRTLDAGNNWEHMTTDNVATLSISLSNPEILLYGNENGEIYKSTNRGTSWSLVSSIALHDWENFDIAIDPVNPDIVYIGTEDGFLKSVDSGASWKVINNGVVDDSIFTLAVDPKDSNRVFVGNFWTRGVFLTEDGGNTWELLEEWRHTQVPDHYPMEIVIDPRDSKVIYITGEYGFKKTTDRGKTWASLDGNLFYGKHVHGLDIDPSNPDILYVGSGKGEESVEGSHVFKTSDGGKTWQDMTNGFPTNEETNVYVIVVADANPNIVYVGTNSHEFVKNPKPTKAMGIYKTIDGGKSWTAVNNGLLNENIFALAVSPKDPNIVYAGTGHEHDEEYVKDHKDGLYRTVDGGQNWEYVDELPRAEVSHIEFHPNNSDIILVSFGENKCAGCGGMPEGKGIYATIDGGKNWYFVSDEFMERQQVVMDVVFDSTGNVIYAGTDDGFIKGKLIIK